MIDKSCEISHGYLFLTTVYGYKPDKANSELFARDWHVFIDTGDSQSLEPYKDPTNKNYKYKAYFQFTDEKNVECHSENLIPYPLGDDFKDAICLEKQYSDNVEIGVYFIFKIPSEPDLEQLTLVLVGNDIDDYKNSRKYITKPIEPIGGSSFNKLLKIDLNEAVFNLTHDAQRIANLWNISINIGKDYTYNPSNDTTYSLLFYRKDSAFSSFANKLVYSPETVIDIPIEKKAVCLKMNPVAGFDEVDVPIYLISYDGDVDDERGFLKILLLIGKDALANYLQSLKYEGMFLSSPAPIKPGKCPVKNHDFPDLNSKKNKIKNMLFEILRLLLLIMNLLEKSSQKHC